MRKRSVLTVLAAAAMALQLFGPTGAAQAQTGVVEYTFSPTSGPPGTKINFSGTGCPHDGTKAQDGFFILSPDGSTGRTQAFTSNAQGAFSGVYDTTNDAARSYITLLKCSTNNLNGIGHVYEVTSVPTTGSTYNPLPPARILDTRDGTGTGGGTNPVGQGATIELKVTEVGGVPASGVTAVALNVTATGANGPGSFLTVYPTGSTKPLASNLNFNAGTAIPNLVIARVGPGGKVSIFNNLGSVHVVADVQGYYVDSQTSASTYVPVNPLRILDTRNGTGATQAKVPAGGTIELTVAGEHGVPSGATAVVLNMTTTQATGPESFLTVYPNGQTRPVVSNLNFTSGPPSTNAVLARVGDGGKVKIFNNLGSTDVVADLNGWFSPPGGATSGQVYYPINPSRALDTRNGTGTPNNAVGQLGSGNTLDLSLVGVGGLPSGATAAVLNVTAADSPGPESFLTLWPWGAARPLASNLNFVANQTIPNLVMVRLGSGKVSIYNNLGSVAVIADVQGWYAPPA